jgi:hypothetical protein
MEYGWNYRSLRFYEKAVKLYHDESGFNVSEEIPSSA